MQDFAIARYDLDGNLSLVQRMGGSENDRGGFGLVADNGIAYMMVTFLSSDGDAPAQDPNAAFPNAFPEKSSTSDKFVLKLNSAAPIVETTSPLSGSTDTPVTLAASASTSDLTTDLSDSIVWTDAAGTTLGTGASVDVLLPVGTHKITASVIDPASGLLGLGGTVVVVTDSSATALYVYDIRFESIRSNRDWRAVFEIRSDSNGDGQGTSADHVAAGVTIEVEFAGRTYTGTTDADGVFRTDWIKNLARGNHYAEVVDLALADYFWDPLLMDLEDDSDGDGLPDDVLYR
jgi:hypothetical protein